MGKNFHWIISVTHQPEKTTLVTSISVFTEQRKLEHIS